MDTDTRQHVQAPLDQLPSLQLAAIETLLESMLDPFSRKAALQSFA